MACARELSLFIAPNVNSYKRTPRPAGRRSTSVWARDNRTCAFRVVGHGSALRIKDRFPGATVNPYLAYAAILAAGLHGVEREIEPPAEFRGNGYTATGVPPCAEQHDGGGSPLSRRARSPPPRSGPTWPPTTSIAARVEQRAFDARGDGLGARPLLRAGVGETSVDPVGRRRSAEVEPGAGRYLEGVAAAAPAPRAR
jgi:glutamine synthetase